jgi:hypothetical protein
MSFVNAVMIPRPTLSNVQAAENKKPLCSYRSGHTYLFKCSHTCLRYVPRQMLVCGVGSILAPLYPYPKAEVCGRLHGEMVGLHPAGGTKVWFLWVVMRRSLRQADHSHLLTALIIIIIIIMLSLTTVVSISVGCELRYCIFLFK